MKRITACFIIFAVLAILPAAPGHAETRVVSTALGADGQLVSLLSGPYGELFPSGTLAQADVNILALRRSLADGQQVLELVPATIDNDRETAAELVLEPVSGISYVFWQSWPTLIQSRFRISGFDGSTWTEPIDVAGSEFAWRTSPAFTVTHDRFSHLTKEGDSEATRTILHVLWSEETEGGLWSTKYAPLVLEDGQYVGQHSLVVLNDLVTNGDAGGATNIRIDPVIRARDNDNSIVAAFLDQKSGQIVTVESKFAPGELSILGDEVDDALAGLSPESDLEPMIAAVRSRLESFSDELKGEVLQPITANIEEYLRGRAGEGGDGIANIRDGARPQLIDFGFRLTDPNIRRIHAEARPQLIDFGARGKGRGHGGPDQRPDLRHDGRSTYTTSFAAPDLSGHNAQPELLLSSSGHHLTLVWAEEDRIRFQEVLPDGSWSELQQISLTDQLDAAKALNVLQRRVDRK